MKGVTLGWEIDMECTGTFTLNGRCAVSFAALCAVPNAPAEKGR